MNWFDQMCRNVGLMFHHAVHPEGTPDQTQTRQVSKTVEEKQIDQTTVLRRTTIEEIEIKEKERGA